MIAGSLLAHGAIHWLAGQTGPAALERPARSLLSHQRDHVANGRRLGVKQRPPHLRIAVIGNEFAVCFFDHHDRRVEARRDQATRSLAPETWRCLESSPSLAQAPVNRQLIARHPADQCPGGPMKFRRGPGLPGYAEKRPRGGSVVGVPQRIL
jgi:hypothetical protein